MFGRSELDARLLWKHVLGSGWEWKLFTHRPGVSTGSMVEKLRKWMMMLMGMKIGDGLSLLMHHKGGATTAEVQRICFTVFVVPQARTSSFNDRGIVFFYSYIFFHGYCFFDHLMGIYLGHFFGIQIPKNGDTCAVAEIVDVIFLGAR